MIIGTAGHIDHGKTTLVKALTGVDCDRLKEEKLRGITLDLGYAYTPLDDGSVLGFVDVPGHEKLVHNMLAGATGIDFALLVIAADDGPMPQTREHLDILQLLGIQCGAVALTKIDAVSPQRLEQAKQEVQELLNGTTLTNAPLFPVAARQNLGIEALRQHLIESCCTSNKLNPLQFQFQHKPHQPNRLHDDCGMNGLSAQFGMSENDFVTTPEQGGFRLAIDRCFSLGGAGTVVTGTAFSGQIQVGDTLRLVPGQLSARVRSLRVHDQVAERGQAGQRIALALTGIEKTDVRRGMWALAPSLHHTPRSFDALVQVLPQQAALRDGTQVHVYLGTEDIPARLFLLASPSIAAGGQHWAHLRLERDLGCVAGDRFVLRDAGARTTLGGGRVLDIFPPLRRKRSPERLAMLAALAATDPTSALQLACEQQAGGISLTRFANNRNLNAAEMQTLCARSSLQVIGDIALAPGQWHTLQQRLMDALSTEHERAPDMIGVEFERLRRLTLPTLERVVFQALVQELLQQEQIAQTRAWLHRPQHRLQLTAKDQAQWEQLHTLLNETPFNPPRVRDMARISGLAEDEARRILKTVARLGLVYPVAHDHYFNASAVTALAERIAALCNKDNTPTGAVRAAELRDQIGGGRKVAIHILEFFDRIGYTRRVRDSHKLRQSGTTESASLTHQFSS